MIIEPTIKSNFLKNSKIETFEEIDFKNLQTEKVELKSKELEEENAKLKKQIEELKLDLKLAEKKSKKGGE